MWRSVDAAGCSCCRRSRIVALVSGEIHGDARAECQGQQFCVHAQRATQQFGLSLCIEPRHRINFGAASALAWNGAEPLCRLKQRSTFVGLQHGTAFTRFCEESCTRLASSPWMLLVWHEEGHGMNWPRRGRLKVPVGCGARNYIAAPIGRGIGTLPRLERQ